MTAVKTAEQQSLSSPGAKITAWLTVGVLLVFYILSTIDRGVISLMVEPLERDLHLRDFELSLLMGPALGLFYVVCGLPMGWLIDKYSRRWIVAIGITIWGIATTCCGLAANFLQLSVARMGVGVGESALNPAAHAIITDRFPAKQLSIALSVYTLGVVIGGALSAVVGGYFVHAAAHMPALHLPWGVTVRSWQIVFLACGGATLICMPLALTLGGKRKVSAEVALTDAPVTLMQLLARHWVLFIGLPVGWGLMNVMVAAFGSWVPTFLIRQYHWNTVQVGAALGAQGLATGIIGQLAGAAVVDWFYARGVTDAHVKYQMITQIISVPLFIIGLNAGSAWGYVLFSSAFYLLTFPCVGYGAAALQLHTPPHLRGQVSAIFIATVSLVGITLGGTTTAILTEFVFHDRAMLGQSLTIVCAVYCPLSLIVLWFVARKVRAMHVQNALAKSPEPMGQSV